MLFEIVHSKRYRYSDAVFIEPQTIRLRPRDDWRQNCVDYRLDLQPAAAGLARNLDEFGNLCEHAWFEGLSDQFALCARSTVRTRDCNPFDFLLEPWAADVPPDYPPELAAALAPYLGGGGGGGDCGPAVAALAADCRDQAGGSLLALPLALAEGVYQAVDYQHRPDGEPLAAAETLRLGRGACRDVAVVFIACARALGLAARFVTGYHDPEEREPELHAWAEVFLPGGGWRGYDPSNGLAVSARHITLAAAPAPPRAATLSGSTRRSASQAFESRLEIVHRG